MREAMVVGAPWPEASGLVLLRGQTRSPKRWARALTAVRTLLPEPRPWAGIV